jgi:hypothetical protein
MANTRDMSFPKGFQRGSAGGCKRSNPQEVDTPRQPVPVGVQSIAHKGTRRDLVNGQ